MKYGSFPKTISQIYRAVKKSTKKNWKTMFWSLVLWYLSLEYSFWYKKRSAEKTDWSRNRRNFIFFERNIIFIHQWLYTFKRQIYEMVKYTQTIRWLLQTNCLSVFDHYVGLACKRLKCPVHLETAARRCSVKMLLWNLLYRIYRKPLMMDSFLSNIAGLQLVTLLKKDSRYVFLWILRNISGELQSWTKYF